MCGVYEQTFHLTAVTCVGIRILNTVSAEDAEGAVNKFLAGGWSLAGRQILHVVNQGTVELYQRKAAGNVYENVNGLPATNVG